MKVDALRLLEWAEPVAPAVRGEGVVRFCREERDGEFRALAWTFEMPPSAEDESPIPFENDPLEDALRRIQDAYDRAIDSLARRYESVDANILEKIGEGTVAPSKEVDVLLGELGIRIVDDPR